LFCEHGREQEWKIAFQWGTEMFSFCESAFVYGLDIHLLYISRIRPCGLFRIKPNIRNCESFLDIFGGTLLDGGSARRKVSTYTAQHNTEKRGHTSVPRAGLEPTICVFQGSKIIRTEGHAATGTGYINLLLIQINVCISSM
jgi:hypothetical protein